MSTVPSFYGLPLPLYRALIQGDVNDFLDADGRPIGEVRASAQVRAQVPTTYRACPYAGSRSQVNLAMNVSALKQASREWTKIVGALDYLRTAYCQRYQCDREQLTLLEFARVAAIGLLLPAYILFRESTSAARKEVPVFVAAAHKMLAGVFSVSKNALICQVAMGNAYDQVLADAQTLFRFAEASNMLVGKTGTEVCAGSPGMIEEALNLLATGKLRAEPDYGPIQALLPPNYRFLDYAEAMGDLLFWQVAFALRTREILTAFTAQLEYLSAKNSLIINWLQKVKVVLAAFKTTGFGAQNLPFGELAAEASEAMIQGMLPLFRGLRAEEKIGALFEQQEASQGDDLTSWLAIAFKKMQWGSSAEYNVARLVARCVQAERQGIRIFSRLQTVIHQALGLAPPAPVTDSTIAAIFGTLASSCVAEVLGLKIRISAEKSVLIDDENRIFEY